jgi:hypothetical protein
MQFKQILLKILNHSKAVKDIWVGVKIWKFEGHFWDSGWFLNNDFKILLYNPIM